MDEDIDGAEYAIFDDFEESNSSCYKFWLDTRNNSTSRTSTKAKSWYTGLVLNLAI